MPNFASSPRDKYQGSAHIIRLREFRLDIRPHTEFLQSLFAIDARGTRVRRCRPQLTITERGTERKPGRNLQRGVRVGWGNQNQRIAERLRLVFGFQGFSLWGSSIHLISAEMKTSAGAPCSICLASTPENIVGRSSVWHLCSWRNPLRSHQAPSSCWLPRRRRALVEGRLLRKGPAAKPSKAQCKCEGKSPTTAPPQYQVALSAPIPAKAIPSRP